MRVLIFDVDGPSGCGGSIAAVVFVGIIGCTCLSATFDFWLLRWAMDYVLLKVLFLALALIANAAILFVEETIGNLGESNTDRNLGDAFADVVLSKTLLSAAISSCIVCLLVPEAISGIHSSGVERYFEIAFTFMALVPPSALFASFAARLEARIASKRKSAR